MPPVIQKSLTCFSILASLYLSAQCTLAHAGSSCHFIEQASLDITAPETSGLPALQGAINGKPVLLALGTGNSRTYILRAEADRQNLNPERTSLMTQGIGGLSSVFLVKVKDFRIGDAYTTNMRFPVLDELGNAGVAGLIGVDFLMQYDVELDLAGHHVKLFRAEHCKDRDLAYWDPRAMSVPMTFTGGVNEPLVRVKINGVPLTALVDTGTAYTTIDLETARNMGLSTESPGVTYMGTTKGIGSAARNVWNITFDTFELGDETVQHPRLAVRDGSESFLGRKEHQVIIGRDFLNAHHVMLATSQMQMYYSHNGARVFQSIDATPYTAVQTE